MAAKNTLAKIATASPEELRERISNTGLYAVSGNWNDSEDRLLPLLREAIRGEQGVEISYADEHGRTTDRVIWPVALAYYEQKQILASWCTMREGVPAISQTDRVADARVVDGRFGKRRAQLMRRWEDSGGRNAMRRRGLRGVADTLCQQGWPRVFSAARPAERTTQMNASRQDCKRRHHPVHDPATRTNRSPT